MEKVRRYCSIAAGVALAVAGAAHAQGEYGSQGGSSAQPGQSQPGQSSQGTSQGQAQKGQSASSSPVVVLVPLLTATDEAMAKGCWARMYDSTNFSGSMLTLSGPVDIPYLRSGRITGFEWDRNFDSVIVGPKATLMVWKGENYREESTTFRSNQRVPDLDTRMGYFDDIDSLKVSCTDMGSGSGAGSGGSTGSDAGTGSGTSGGAGSGSGGGRR